MRKGSGGKTPSVIRKREEGKCVMTDLDKLRQWLMTYPGWDGELQVDFVDPEPGNAGLFPEGLEETEHKEDILGNLQIFCRYRFVLYRQMAGQQDGTHNAQWLLAFQNWVQQQSAEGLAPQFGDVPERERLQARSGALKKADQVGTGTYTVTLIAEFMKVYEVK